MAVPLASIASRIAIVKGNIGGLRTMASALAQYSAARRARHRPLVVIWKYG
jgi:hypothetical protein